jgi:hypothetical protein
MGKRAPKPPKPPDPDATARAQAAANKDTAIAQAHLNMINQVTPFGTLTYTQRGTAPDGTPQYTLTQTLSPDQQRLLDLENRVMRGYGGLAARQLGQVRDALSQPLDFGGRFNLDNNAVEGRLISLGRRRLDPIFNQRRQELDADLLNRGFSVGDEGYSRAMQELARERNDALTQLLLSGRGQATQEALAQRQQQVQEALMRRQMPLNELAALASGTQVQLPTPVPTVQTQVQPTDYLGAQQLAYQGRLADYNARSQMRMAGLGGLYGLGSAALTGWMLSDRRLKRDVRRIGALPSGLGVYRWRYVVGGPEYVGLMADEVARVKPDAVALVGGFQVIDYGRLAGEASP